MGAQAGHIVLSRISAIVLAGALIGAGLVLQPIRGLASSVCGDYDWAEQWTSTSAGYYTLPTCIYQAPHYYGWVGINGQITTPAAYPNLGGNTGNHTVGWLDVNFSVCGGCRGNWIQIGWFAGCLPAFCDQGQIGLYDETQYTSGGVTTLVEEYYGTLNYNSADIYEITYAGSGRWNDYDHYNNLLAAFTGRPGSGEMRAGSEVCCNDSSPGYVQMPYQYFGYSSPNTNNALRIKGGNGWVPWNATLSTGGTAQWDERNCPNPSYCPGSPAYTLQTLNADYYIKTYGAT